MRFLSPTIRNLLYRDKTRKHVDARPSATDKHLPQRGDFLDEAKGPGPHNKSQYAEPVASTYVGHEGKKRPDIYHYWFNKHLRPKLKEHGISDLGDFFFQYVFRYCTAHAERQVNIVSLGSGCGDMEVRLVLRLLERGVRNFKLTCLAATDTIRRCGLEAAGRVNITQFLKLCCLDLNHWKPHRIVDIYIANQSLRNILSLERVLDGVHETLNDQGWFLIFDKIGRNSHQHWPEATEFLKPLWQQIPPSHRSNHTLQPHNDVCANQVCAAERIDGVSAQDILPLLNQRMHFELFLPFANLISVFVEPPFGYSFDQHNEWATHFIDRVQKMDEDAFVDGILKPTQMIAATSKSPRPLRLVHEKLTPKYCVRWPD